MQRFAGRNIFILIAIPILLVLLLSELVSFEDNNPAQETRRVYKVFEKKEKRLEAIVDTVVSRFSINPAVLSDWSLLSFIGDEKEELSVAVTNGNTLLFWSSSLIAFPADEGDLVKSEGLIHLPTGWYYQISRKSGANVIKGFLLIKREFPYRNRFIKSAFNSDFKLSDEYSVKLTPQPGALNIYKPDGTFLFSVSTFNDRIRFTRTSNLSAVLYFAFILMMLAHLNVWLRRIKRLLPGQKLFISLGVSVVIYLIINGLKIPSSLYQTDLFSPASFAFSGWLASLGEFILLSILMFHGAQAFFVLTDFEKVQKGRSVWMIFSFLFAAFFFTSSVALMKILLLNSSISLEFFLSLIHI